MRERGEGARGKREEGREILGRAYGVWVGSFFSLPSFLFLFYTQTFKPFHLNSNKFEFNPHK
jgi:hypothetical protein